jgi:CBS domain-containing protein
MVTARQVMTDPVITVAATASLGDVAEAFKRHRISAVPVMDEAGAVVGLVSRFDLLSRTGSNAGEVMTTALITVTQDTDVEDIRQLFLGRRIHSVPVMAGGHLVGIVSPSDLFRFTATEWVCIVCGESFRDTEPPEACAMCHGGGERFELQEQSPGP